MIRPPPADRMWAARADELDGGGWVGGQDGLDLLVGQFLSGAKTPYPALLMATSIRPNSATVRSMTARSAAVSHVSTSARNPSGCALARSSTVVGLRTVPDPLAACQQLFGEVTAEAAADSGDQPNSLCHNAFLLLAGGQRAR